MEQLQILQRTVRQGLEVFLKKRIHGLIPGVLHRLQAHVAAILQRLPHEGLCGLLQVQGQIATRHVIPPRNFYSDWTFLDHAILGEKGSLGYHHHEALEESFVVLKGQGLMKIEDEIFEVRPGSVTWQGIEQKHSLSNPGPEKLEFVRIAVRQAYTTIDV